MQDIKSIRESRKIPARKVYTALGIDKTTFRKVENRQASLKAEWLPIMADIYGLSKERLLEIYLNERWLKNDRVRRKDS